MFNQEKPEVAAAQKVMLEILKEIHRICVDNNITYWLTAGTLLGAVRHKGFIPWDDDCDVAMPREDYDKFLKIAQKFLPETMLLQTHETEPAYTLPFAKIRKKNTLLIETGETGEENYHHGIFVDIFPFDNCKYKWLIRLMYWNSTFRDKKKNYRKGSLRRFFVILYTNVLMWLPYFLITQLRKLLIKHPRFYKSYSKESYMTYGFECTVSVGAPQMKEILPTVLHLQCFEGYDFYLPNSVHSALRANFGNSYMMLPTTDKRKIHSKHISFGCDEHSVTSGENV